MKTMLISFAKAGLAAGLSSIAACSVLGGLAAAQPQTRYTVVDLGTLGGTYSFAFGINNAGKVAGAAATPAQTDGFSSTAFLWTKQNGMINLGVLGPPDFPFCPMCSSGAAGVGASGEVAVGSEIATPDPHGQDFCQFYDPANPASANHRGCRAAIWRNGVLTGLQTLTPGGNTNALWINNLGQVSGFAETGKSDPSCSIVTPFQVQQFQPVIWGPDGKIQRVLSPLVLMGDTVAYAMTINDHGQAVGASGLCSTTGLPPAAINNTTATHAVMWDRDGSITDLGSLGGAVNVAGNINNRGEVVGTSPSPIDGTVHAFKWTRQTGIQDYGAFPGAVATIPGCCHTLNDRGEIVGFAILPDDMRALVWQGTEPKDLNDFVAGPSPFVQLLAAFSISDAGEIIGVGVTQTGDAHAFLASPNNRATAHESFSPLLTQGKAQAMVPEKVRELPRGGFGMRRK